jgi:hypothetical protein
MRVESEQNSEEDSEEAWKGESIQSPLGGPLKKLRGKA